MIVSYLSIKNLTNKFVLLSILAGVLIFTACNVLTFTACNNASDTASAGTDSTHKDTTAIGTGNSNNRLAKDSSSNDGATLDTVDATFLKKAASSGLLEVQREN